MVNDKELLLQTQMNRLGLGDAFDKYFLQKKMDQGQVITLSQFFELNTDLRRNLVKGIQCVPADALSAPRRKLLSKSSSQFQLLKDFLLLQGFTPDDWGMLLPKGQGGRLDYSKLSHDKLLCLPVFHVTDVKATLQPMEQISIMFFGEDMYGTQILVKNMLGITKKDVVKKLIKKTKKNRKVFSTLKTIQTKLGVYGFNKKYPFMKISF